MGDLEKRGAKRIPYHSEVECSTTGNTPLDPKISDLSATGAFMKVTPATDLKLVAAASPVAKIVEIHEMAMDGGVMKMRELAKGLEIKPGETVELKPGSYHVMMMNVSKPFTKGDRVKASLTFERAGKVDIEFAVEAVGGAPEHKH